ncbi:hypothetical protein MIMGU_mgv1a017287mg [Erythranthe guttata]|uniref:Uncharacterized protein n=1 Tax=Erythranthe guttata TaxID=4155 RepID=A0A022QTP5_ERYGU|nr:hypothetical protein MIMGU_mgv1a017287mg [Erythranthe guttata]
MKYADFTVVYEGTLGVVFNKINAKIYAAIYGVDIDSHIDRFGLPRLYTRSFMQLDNFVPSNDNDTGSRPTANLIALIDKRQEGN